jgi:hypothetical protein
VRKDADADKELKVKTPSLLLAVINLVGLSEQASGQGSAKDAQTRWRPRDGVYAVPGAGFSAQCGNMNGAFVELANNTIGGDEYRCKIGKTTDSAPDLIRFEATCEGVEVQKPTKEVILFKRLDDSTFLWRHVTPGSRDRGIKFKYCPDHIQQLYRENEARSKAEAEQKDAAEKSQQKQ